MEQEPGDVADVEAEELKRFPRRGARYDSEAKAAQVKREREQAEDTALLREAIDSRDKEKVLTALRVLGLPAVLLDEVETLWKGLSPKRKKGRS